MTVRYQRCNGQLLPIYVCQRERIQNGERICQSISGAGIDEAIGKLLVATVTPTVLEVALRVRTELQNRMDEVDQILFQHVERARYEAELSRRRFMQVDPENRLVADALEAEWNERLRAQQQAQEQYETKRSETQSRISAQQRERVLALATDFEALWRDPTTSHRDRKRMVRLLVEDVTLVKRNEITAHIRFKGGATDSLALPIPLNAWKARQTPQQIVAKIDRLLDAHTDGQVASLLNDRGYTSGQGKPFTAVIVQKIRRKYGLESRRDRLRAAGLMTLREVSSLLGVHWSTVKAWREHGLLLAVPYNDKNECLYPHPGPNLPVKQQGTKLRERSKK